MEKTHDEFVNFLKNLDKANSKTWIVTTDQIWAAESPQKISTAINSQIFFSWHMQESTIYSKFFRFLRDILLL